MAALRPGGRLVLMDFPPEPGSSIPAGVPENRGGHGIPVSVIVSEMTQSGFRHVTTLSRWPPDDSRTRLFRVVEDPDGHILRFWSEPKEVRDDGRLSLEDPRYGVLLREKSSSGGSAAGQRYPCRPGEATFPEIRPAPLPIVVSALRAHTDARVLADNLPDLPSATA